MIRLVLLNIKWVMQLFRKREGMREIPKICEIRRFFVPPRNAQNPKHAALPELSAAIEDHSKWVDCAFYVLNLPFPKENLLLPHILTRKDVFKFIPLLLCLSQFNILIWCAYIVIFRRCKYIYPLQVHDVYTCYPNLDFSTAYDML